MKKLWIILGLMFVVALSSVMGASCVGNPTNDSAGCTLNSNVVQTADITFSVATAITVSSGSWNCNGYKLIGQGKGSGTLFREVGANLQGVQVYNCDISDTDVVWYMQHTQTSGTMQNNFLNNSKIDNVGTVMQFDGLNHVSYSFSINNNGLAGNNITNSDYGMVTTGVYNQDGTGAGIFKNNKMTGGNISVRIGHTSGGYYTFSQGTLNNWVISGNEFQGQTEAGIWVMQGSSTSLATISNNLFNGSKSGILSERAGLTISGNTFSNGAKGQNGCIEPPYQGVPLVVTTSNKALCSGTYNQTNSIIVDNGVKIYPSGAIGTLTLQDYGAGTSITTSDFAQGNVVNDNVEIYGINFLNFTYGIYPITDCYTFPVITDTLDNWNIHDNVFTDLSKQAVRTSYGIYWFQDDVRYCRNNNMVMRDNIYNNLDVGIYFDVQNNIPYYVNPYGGTNEISFSTFNNVTEGIKEDGLIYHSNFIIVFNNFNITNNSIRHTSFDWFGNSGIGGVYIQDQNNCQKPDLAYLADEDVTYCSGTFIIPAGKTIIPSQTANIYCDGTILVDDTYHSSAGMIISGYFLVNGEYKLYQMSSGAEVDGCTFKNFSSGIQFYGTSASSYMGQVNDIVIKNNTFDDVQWGIYLYAGGDYTYTGATGWQIYGNNFNDITDEGIFIRADTGSNPLLAMPLSNWYMHHNTFNSTKYGIRISGDNSGTNCYNKMSNMAMDNNIFHNNENHIRIEHPDPVQCPSQSPTNVTAHYNTFARDFTAFAVSNTHALSYDFTLNNWGTGYTGIIDEAIYDDLDSATYGVINYIPIIGYTLFYGTPFAVQENWESALATDSESVVGLPITYQSTGYDTLKNFIGNEEWLLARSNANARGTVYLSDDATCLSTYCYKSQVDSLDGNPQYARVTRFFQQTVNMSTDTAIRFKVLYNSTYWDSGGALIFRKEDDSIAFKIDLGLTNETNYATATDSSVCKIMDIASMPYQVGIKNNDVWYSFDISLQDIKNACPVVYANIFNNAKRLDRIEFVFGGKRNGVLGEVLWYIDDIEVENVDFNSPPPNTPPSGSFIKFQERFGQGYNFDVTEADCFVKADGFEDIDFAGHTPKYVGGDNDWICWLNSTGGSPSIDYEDSSDTLHISSDLGIMHTVSGSVNPTISSWATSGNYNIDMQGGNADHFLFTCDMSNQTHGYSYLLFAKDSGETMIDELKAGYISLKNGGCAYNNSLPYQNDIWSYENVTCCELIDIAGQDCSGGKTAIDFTQQDVENNCVNMQDYNFMEIDRLEFVTLKRTTGTDQVFFDDIYLYNTGFIANNSLPSILTMDCVPDPVDVSSPTSCGVGISDSDNPANETYSAFDCDTSTPSLDYGWALRGQTPVFSCTFATENTFTQKLYVSDVPHYPTYNVSLTDTTTAIIVVIPPRPTEGGSCSGYIAQTCTGTCYFTDNFNYDKMIQCAGWSGSVGDFHPTSNVMGIYGTTIYDSGFELDKGNGAGISSSQWDTFDVEFDFRLNSNEVTQFNILDNELNSYINYLVFQNYVVKAYSPETTLGTVADGEWHNLRININFPTQKLYYYLDDALVGGTINFYESATTARKFTFGWSDTDNEIDIDNFRITYGQQNANATNQTTTTESVSYTYNPELFCAVNWTSNSTHKFNEQNCRDRGFSVDYPFVGLCIPRACIQDVGLMLLASATANIFTTIIIVTAFILVIPLIISLLKGRRR